MFVENILKRRLHTMNCSSISKVTPITRYARRVLEWLIDDTKVPELEVFSDKFGLTIVTESLKNRLEEVGVTGLAFISLGSLKEPLLGT